MTDRIWTAAVAAIMVFVAGLYGWNATTDPIVTVDRPLPDLPAVTLDGRPLDQAFFGTQPWIISLWMPG